MDLIRAEVENEMRKNVIENLICWMFSFHSKRNAHILINCFLVSEGDHEKVSKKEILLGRRKDKKDKKDKGYAALDGESSQEEDLDAK